MQSIPLLVCLKLYVPNARVLTDLKPYPNKVIVWYYMVLYCIMGHR